MNGPAELEWGDCIVGAIHELPLQMVQELRCSGGLQTSISLVVFVVDKGF